MSKRDLINGTTKDLMAKDLVVKDLVAGLILLALVFLSKMFTMDLPYHWDEMGAYIPPAHWLSEGSLIRAVPGFYPAAKFFGHPTGLYLSLAIIYKAVGESLWISHLFAAGFAYLGILYTFLLGRFLYNRVVGFTAALFLFGTPLYFAQSGQVLGDIPITAFGVMSVYYAIRGKYLPYLICSIYMLMLKETSLAIVAGLLIFILTTEWGKLKIGWKIIKYSVPGMFLGVFFVLQKMTTGHFFCNPYFESNPALKLSISEIFVQFVWVSNWTLLMQHRWILILSIVLAVVVHRRAAWKKEYTLFIMIMVFFVCAFSFLFFMTRYIQPVLPYLCIMSAASMTLLVKNFKLQMIVTVIVLAVFGTKYYENDRGYNCYDDNMQYMDIVNVNKDICMHMQSEFEGERILTIWPVYQALREPYLGYVEEPFEVVSLNQVSDIGDFDVLVFVENPGCGSDQLKVLIEREKMVLHRRFTRNGKPAEIYVHRGARD